MRDFESDRDNSTASCGCGKLRRPIEKQVINVDVYDNRLSQHTVPPDVNIRNRMSSNMSALCCPLFRPFEPA